LGAKVLDAFAGSGAMGLEAMSRGASSVVLVDNNRRATDVINRNLVALKLKGSPNCQVLLADALAPGFSRRLAAFAPFDLVILDPPYDTSRQQIGMFLSRLIKAELMDSGCLVSYECQAGGHTGANGNRTAGKTVMQSAGHWPEALEMVSYRQYGNSAIEYYRFAGDTDVGVEPVENSG
jgi:16S rRNA (guanine966-N2)-methyltransferase